MLFFRYVSAYYHYKDIYDLQDQIVNDILIEIDDVFSTCPSHNLNDNPLQLLHLLIDTSHKTPNSAKFFLNGSKNHKLTKELSSMLRDKYIYTWVASFNKIDNTDDINYYCDFIMAGFVSMTNVWLDNNEKDSEEVLAKKMIDIALYGLCNKK